MEHGAAELERQVLDVPATTARPGRRRHRGMDRQQALSRLVPVGSAGFRESATARADSGCRVALGNYPWHAVSYPSDEQECSESAIEAAAADTIAFLTSEHHPEGRRQPSGSSNAPPGGRVCAPFAASRNFLMPF